MLVAGLNFDSKLVFQICPLKKIGETERPLKFRNLNVINHLEQE